MKNTIDKTWLFGRFTIRFYWSPSSNLGHFGGGWNWAVGFRLGGSTILFELLFCYLTISWYKRK